MLFLPDHDDWDQTLKSMGHTNPRDWFQSMGATHVLLDATFWNGEELPGRDMKDVLILQLKTRLKEFRKVN